ncbi:MAG: hypothetical protein HRT36_05925 [Alphaproteobacteria bacterium]|nr:hypothetical protein [Alphaproteobacteria bacterium]
MAATVELYSTAKKNNPVQHCHSRRKRANHVKRAVNARLISSITPKISVNPATIKNSITPNYKPFNACPNSNSGHGSVNHAKQNT